MPRVNVLPTVTVAVLNYNGVQHLRDCFESIVDVDYPRDRLELMLVDNASSDGSVAFVEEAYPHVRVVRNETNVGFGTGNNVGAREATSDFIVFLNNDMWVDPGFIRGLVEVIGEERICAAAKILNWDGSCIDYAGSAAHFAGYGYQRHFGKRTDEVQHDEAEPTFFACGGAMMVDRRAFLEAGGFDDDYFIYYEDVDLGWRLWILGYEVWYAPNAVAYHRHHGTMEHFADHRKRVLYRRNSLASVYKNYDDEHFGRFLAAALLGSLDGVVTTASATGRLNPRAFEITGADRTPSRLVPLSLDEASTIVAVHELVKELPGLQQKRADIQSRRVRTDAEVAELFRWPFGHWPGVSASTHSTVVRAFGVDELFVSLPRRVVVLSPDILPYKGLPTVGSGLRAWALAEALRARGHDVLLSMPREATVGREDILPAEVLDRAWDRANLAQVILREAPDAVVVCGWPVLDALPTEELGVPVILDQAGPHFLERRYQRYGTDAENTQSKLRALRKADYFTSSGRRQHAYFEKWLDKAGWTREEIEERSASIPYSLSPELPERTPGEEFTFVYGGVFLPWQDPTIALETLVSELGRRDGAKLHLFGAHHPYSAIPEGRVSALFERLETSSHVVRHGFIPYEELLGFYTRAHVAIDLMAANPERELAFTTRTVVYLWSGLPVIYNDYSELSEYIARYDAGWTVDPSDPDAIRGVLAEIFADPDRLVRKGQNAQRLVREQLDWTSTIEPLDGFLRRGSLRISHLAAGNLSRAAPSLIEKVRWVYRTHGAGAVFRKALFRARDALSSGAMGRGEN